MALCGFGLLFSEFERLLRDMGAGEVGLAVDELNVEFGFFFEALDERRRVGTAKEDFEEIRGGEVHGGFEDDVGGGWRRRISG